MTKWYEKGLQFSCTECGACCTGAPGYVWVDDDEIEAMAKSLGISSKEFMAQYTRYVKGRYSLLEDPKTYDCIFLRDKKCTLYKARPKQCRTFPWWKENLKSKKDWEDLKSYCEGIDHHDGKVFSLDEIEKFL